MEWSKKKAGWLIDDDKDVERRKQLATVALYELINVWIKGNKLKTSTKIRLYKSLVKSIVLYNCGTWALTLTEEERLNAYHRKQLKKILNIRYLKKKKKLIALQNLPRKATVITNAISLLEFLWSYSTKRQRQFHK